MTTLKDFRRSVRYLEDLIRLLDTGDSSTPIHCRPLISGSRIAKAKQHLTTLRKFGDTIGMIQGEGEISLKGGDEQ